MVDEKICPTCHGTGDQDEVAGDLDNAWFEPVTCRMCWGRGLVPFNPLPAHQGFGKFTNKKLAKIVKKTLIKQWGKRAYDRAQKRIRRNIRTHSSDHEGNGRHTQVQADENGRQILVSGD
jgi:hypothetical protein